MARIPQWVSSLFAPSAFVTSRDLESFAVAAVLVAGIYWVSRRKPVFADQARGMFVSIERAHGFILAAALIPLLIRLALLPWLPPPEPIVHDEFAHLLTADTLLLGRLANPPHALWKHFETNYVLQQPAYASVYPLGQGFILAVGKFFFGSAWVGLLLSVALMCGGIAWMLAGCLPAGWAAAAGLLAAFQLGLSEQWMDTYYGGAVPAFGGALMFGSLCRLRGSFRLSLTTLAAVGWAIVWFTRPFESSLLLVVLLGSIGFIIVRNAEPVRWKVPVSVLIVVLTATGALTALHNKTVTGSAITLPYQHEQRMYGVPQNVIWQKAIAQPVLVVPELQAMYMMQSDHKKTQVSSPVAYLMRIARTVWSFFIAPWYAIPFLVVAVVMRKDPDVIAGLGLVVIAVALSGIYPGFYTRYVAAYSCIFFFLIGRGLMKIWEWAPAGKAVGGVAVLLLACGGASLAVISIAPTRVMFGSKPRRAVTAKEEIVGRLKKIGGKHVIFVRYGPGHSFHHELVYNAADIDSSQVIWCRVVTGLDNAEVVKYYPVRKFWVLDVDSLDRYSLAPYDGSGL